ncbi:MAG: hypothetical protein V1647_01600, partial [Pseudomonadota bacterium]
MFNKERILERLRDFSEKPRVRLYFFIMVFSFTLSVAVNINLSKPYKDYRFGDFADGNVKASQSVEFEDIESTERLARETEKLIPPVFDYDPGTLNSVKQRVHEAFKNLRRNVTDVDGRKKFEDSIGRIVDDQTYAVVLRNGFSWRIERAVLYALGAVPDRYIVDDRDTILEEASGEIVINDVSRDDGSAYYRDGSKRLKTTELLQLVITLDEVRQMMQKQMQDIFAKFSKEERAAIMSMADTLVRANLTFNKEKTVHSKQQAREKLNKIVIRVSRGDIIVRDGEPIEKRQLMILDHLREAGRNYQNVVLYFFYFMLFSLVLYSLTFYVRSSIYMYKAKTRDLIVIGLFTVCYTLGFKLWSFISLILAGYITDIPLDIFLMLFPFVAMAFVIRIL